MGHVLVTGGSRGIGAAVRALLLERGELVSFTAATLAGDGAILTPDPAATDWGEVLDRAESASGPLTALVNNAGVTGGLAAFVDSGKGVVVLTDMFGGSPSNLAISAMERSNVEVIAGVNLPMLVKLASVRGECALEEAVTQAQDAGRKYISVASQILAAN